MIIAKQDDEDLFLLFFELIYLVGSDGSALWAS